MYIPCPPFPSRQEIMFYNIFHIQAVTKKFTILSKKELYIFGACHQNRYFCIRFRERRQRAIDILTGNGVRTLSFFHPLASVFNKAPPLEKKKEKNFRKYLEVMLESSYLCTRFQNGSSDKLDILIWTRCAGLSPFFFCLPFAKRDDEEKENKKKLPKIFGRYT